MTNITDGLAGTHPVERILLDIRAPIPCSLTGKHCECTWYTHPYEISEEYPYGTKEIKFLHRLCMVHYALFPAGKAAQIDRRLRAGADKVRITRKTKPKRSAHSDIVRKRDITPEEVMNEIRRRKVKDVPGF